MRDFLLGNGEWITTVIAAAELLIAVLLLFDSLTKRKTAIVLMLLITLGLSFDAGVLAAGSLLPENILLPLSRARYVAHGLLLPLSVALCAYALKWEFTPGMKIAWLITVPLSLLGAAAGFVRVIAPVDFAGLLRYAPTDASPAWVGTVNTAVSTGSVLLLIAVGIAVIIRDKKPWLFLGGLLMLVFSVLGPITGNVDLIFLISMAGELLMVLCFLIYEKSEYEPVEEYY